MILCYFYIAILSGNPDVEIIEKNNSKIVLNVSFSEEREGPINVGFVISPDIPVFEYRLKDCDTTEVKEVSLSNSPVKIGCPINLMEYRLFPVLVHSKFSRNSVNVNVRRMELKLDFENYQNINLPQSLGQVFKNLILNYEYNPQTEPGGLLIITPNSFYNAVLPLADWKEKKGWKVTVARLSDIGGNNPTAIKNYIADAYHNWSPKPEYVILIGDHDSLKPASYLAPPGPTDYPYTLIDGDDFLGELLIGRLSVVSVSELNMVVAKILGYEKNPYTSETQWFKRALMVGANMPSNMTTPIPVKRWVREKLIEYGFNTVDTVFYPMAPSNITTSINQGVLFVNYRSGEGDFDGWPFPFFKNNDVYALTNGWKLPVVMSITCYTGNFQAEPCFGEVWLRSGNPTTPKGAVGFIGASGAYTSSRWNNCLDYGIYWGILKEEIYNLGSALYRGKMELYMNFPHDTTWTSGSSFYFHTYNLLGDPSLEVWTDVPQNFVVNHQATIPVGTNSFSVQVLNSSSQPVKGAMVSIYKKNETKEVEFTNSSGLANFQITTTTPDTLFVTVTKHNFKPYCGYALVNNASVYVGYYSHTISDPNGNNNGKINPGEAINLSITLKNFGNSTTANNVTAKLSTTDPLITITDSIKTYGSIAPGATANSSPYVFNTSQNIKNNHTIKFNLTINSSQGNWNSVLWLIAEAPEFEYRRSQILDGGNGVLEPGETSDLTITIKNIGNLSGANINGILRSKNPGVVVLDSIGDFGNVAVGYSVTNSGNRFKVGASS
ncbi:MAG: C25 family cysteine peptidase, partial [candidate division WOR-3 bacterium]